MFKQEHESIQWIGLPSGDVTLAAIFTVYQLQWGIAVYQLQCRPTGRDVQCIVYYGCSFNISGVTSPIPGAHWWSSFQIHRTVSHITFDLSSFWQSGFPFPSFITVFLPSHQVSTSFLGTSLEDLAATVPPKRCYFSGSSYSQCGLNFSFFLIAFSRSSYSLFRVC